MTYQPGLYSADQISNSEYHAQRDVLSASGAKAILEDSLGDFRYNQTHAVHKDVFDAGTAAHELVLEGEFRSIQVLEYDSYRTKAAQEARDDARALGKTSMLERDLEDIYGMAKALRDNVDAMALLESGQPEVSAFFTDPVTGLECRTRFDWLPEIDTSKRLVIPDYKTAKSANPRKFRKDAANYRYHQQLAWYEDTLPILGIHHDVKMVLIAQEKTAPYASSVVQFAPRDLELGRALNELARRKFKHSLETDHWPFYPGVTQLELPEYAHYEGDDLLDAA